MSTLVVLGIVAVVIFTLIAWVIGLYNGLVAVDEKAKSAWSGIEVQLKRRHDLVPALAKAVSSATGYEKGVMDKIIEARTAAVKALQSGDVNAIGTAEGQLAQGLKAFFSYTESNPQLTATANIATFQRQLEDTEDQIAAARRFFNSAVELYNSTVRAIPSNIVAGMMGMTPRSMIEFPQAQREAIQEMPEFKLAS
jgi:LemA protein